MLHLGQEESRGHISPSPTSSRLYVHIPASKIQSRPGQVESHQPACTRQQGQPQSQVTLSGFKSHPCHTPTAAGTGNRQQWGKEMPTAWLVWVFWGGEGKQRKATTVRGGGCHIWQQLTQDKWTVPSFSLLCRRTER